MTTPQIDPYFAKQLARLQAQILTAPASAKAAAQQAYDELLAEVQRMTRAA